MTDHIHLPQCKQKASGKPLHFQSIYQKGRNTREPGQGLCTHNISYNYSITREDSKHACITVWFLFSIYNFKTSNFTDTILSDHLRSSGIHRVRNKTFKWKKYDSSQPVKRYKLLGPLSHIK